MTIMERICVDFDFTSDTPGYWDGFWERHNGLGMGKLDPDTFSPTLREYHKILWSRELPNGEHMVLVDDPSGYLQWNGMRFSSDNIAVSFRYERCRKLLESVESNVDNYREMIENFEHKAYTIGGSIIFPRHRNSINQIKGTNRYISDRWDLTLECIRRFYVEEESPISWCLEQDKAFFNLFVDFKGYVEFFFLQDCVSEDFSSVVRWIDTELFERDPFPRDCEEYDFWISKNVEFVHVRNMRIRRYLDMNQNT